MVRLGRPGKRGEKVRGREKGKKGKEKKNLIDMLNYKSNNTVGIQTFFESRRVILSPI